MRRTIGRPAHPCVTTSSSARTKPPQYEGTVIHAPHYARQSAFIHGDSIYTTNAKRRVLRNERMKVCPFATPAAQGHLRRQHGGPPPRPGRRGRGGLRRGRAPAAGVGVRLRINPIVTSEKQLLNMILSLV
jgi:hypothetical protein